MKKLSKFIIAAGLVLIFLYALKQILEWYTPVNENGFSDAQHCIFENKNHQKTMLHSMGHNFEVTYIKNASDECLLPHFPAIHITTESAHNKWIFVDYKSRSLFVPNTRLMFKLGEDSEKAEKTGDSLLREQLFKDFDYQGHMIFYSSEKEFFSNHGDGYTLFTKNSINWTGHAWAIQADLDKKTIRCVGGISWGFKVPWYSLWPVMILPQALTQEDWQNDWDKLSQKSHFKGYKNID